jgi:hypothetical protein
VKALPTALALASALLLGCEGRTHYLGSDYSGDAAAQADAEPNTSDASVDSPDAALPEGASKAGLLLAWSFDDVSTEVASDSSGNRRDGSLTDAPSPSEPAPTRNAANLRGRFFNGTGATARCALDAPLLALTLALWLKPADLNRALIASFAPDDGGPDLRVRFEDAHVVLEMGSGSAACTAGSTCVSSGQPGVLDRWLHIAAVREADGTLRLFIDGSAQGSAAADVATPALGLVQVGAARGVGDEGVRGVIDEVVLYGRALTLAEIGALAGTAESGAKRSR